MRGYRSISLFDLESFPLNSFKAMYSERSFGVRLAIIFLLCYYGLYDLDQVI